MPGTWLTRLARRLLHEDTFDAVVSPAIADLQFESTAGGRHPVIGDYAGVCMALAGGLWRDATIDARGLRDDGAILTAIAGIQTAYYTAMMTLVFRELTAERTFAVVIVLLGLSTMATALCFWPQRRRLLDS